MVSLLRTALATRTLLQLARAFTVTPVRTSNKLTQFAKPLPIDSFDLSEIEEFELQLDALSDANAENDNDDEDAIEDCMTIPRTILDFTIPESLDNKRIDAALAGLINKSRSFCGTLVSTGKVEIDDSLVDRKSFKVSTDQKISVQIPEPPPVTVVPEKVPLDIIFEDEYIMVINKQPNMVVHPGAGNWNGTIVNGLAYYLQHSPFGAGNVLDVADSLRPGIVHRLDKDTTGVLVVAKTQETQAKLKEQFASRKVKKAYLAMALGNPGPETVVDNYISRHPFYRQRMRVVPNDAPGVGKRAVSKISTLGYDHEVSFVYVQIKTGRTHQIRVHLQHLKTPVYGDDVYGLPKWNKQHRTKRPLLHAYKLQLDHPVTGETMLFQAPLPSDMRVVALQVYPDGPTALPSAFAET